MDCFIFKRNKIQTHVTTWINFDNISLNGISLTQRHILQNSIYMRYLNVKFKNTASGIKVSSIWGGERGCEELLHNWYKILEWKKVLSMNNGDVGKQCQCSYPQPVHLKSNGQKTNKKPERNMSSMFYHIQNK